jgi:hypothetical protein
MVQITHHAPRMVTLAVLIMLAGLLVPATPAEASTGTAERDFICRVNKARSDAGEARLRIADDLTRVARKHSRTMAAEGRLHHNPSLGSDVQHWSMLAENVGVGRSVSSLHSALMDSPGHRRNILDSRPTQIGVGVVESGGRLWVTQVFRRPTLAIATTRASCGGSSATTTSAVIPVVGDWNGDGHATPGTFENGRWRLSNDLGSGVDIEFGYGSRGDLPVVGDWNGNGHDTVGVVRDGTWHLRNSLSGGPGQISFAYGRVSRGDIPLVGDWNGNGHDTVGVVRDGTWHLRNSLSGGPGQISFAYGRVSRGDIPLVGDWNGNRRDTAGIVRDGTWHLRNSLSGGPGQISFAYGRVSRGDIPVVGDWTGDDEYTPGIVRSRTWHLRDALAGGSADWSFNF